MIVMPSSSTGGPMRRIADEFPGALWHLFSPEGWRSPWLPYALDNGAFTAYRSGERWKQREYLGLCEKAVACGRPPAWLLAPDVVADRAGTLRSWECWHRDLARWYGWPLAFAVQDGMTEADVPREAAVVFVGGSTDWKWRTLSTWAAAFPRVHVGRVNGYRAALQCARLGIESIDGTGWMRTDRQRWHLRCLLRQLAVGSLDHPVRGGDLFHQEAVA